MSASVAASSSRICFLAAELLAGGLHSFWSSLALSARPEAEAKCAQGSIVKKPTDRPPPEGTSDGFRAVSQASVIKMQSWIRAGQAA